MIRWRRGQGGSATLTCAEVGRVLQAHLDGELEADRARGVAAHLDGCRDCGLEARAFSEIKAALHRHAGSLPPGAVQRLRDFGQRLIDHGDGTEMS